MKIITVRSQIREIADRWRAWFKPHKSWFDAKREATYQQLLALDTATATPEDVAAVIGNDSWIKTELACHECGTAVQAVVAFEFETEYGTDYIWLCAGCCRKAAATIEAVIQEIQDGPTFLSSYDPIDNVPK